MILPFLVFWLLLFFSRDELGIKGIAFCVAVWLVLLLLFVFSGISPLIFVAVQSVLDIVLVLVTFGGDIRIR